MKCLFLDDERFPDEVFWISYKHYKDMDFTIVRTSLDFKYAIEQQEYFDVISFDNDLSEETEGFDLLYWYINKYLDGQVPKLPSKFILHTQNDVVRERMQSLLDNFAYHHDLDFEVINFER